MIKRFKKRAEVKRAKDAAILRAILEKKTGHKLEIRQETPEQWIKRHTMPQ